jgi:5-methylcytosine-specific restriction endonuclease McrA
VAAACGVPLVEIGKILGRAHSVVRGKLLLEAKLKLAKCQKSWYKQNRQDVLKKQRAYHALNREVILKRQRSYQSTNAVKVAKKNRRWYLANRQHAAKVRRLYYEANLERLQQLHREWLNLNPGKCVEYTRRWRKNNEERAREYVRQRYARRRAGRQAALQPLTFDQRVKRFAIWSGRCSYCFAADDMTVDHLLPLSLGGLDDASNIVPACRRCNTSKNASPVESWYRRQPWFTEARWAKIVKHCPAAAAGQLPLALPV